MIDAHVIDAHVVVHRPSFTLDLAISAAAGEVVALLGPNGSGKTTTLRALAGLVPLSDGAIILDDAPLHTTPAERRPIGMVFQDYLLFPHLSALENVAFGPRCRGVAKAEARRRAAEWLTRVGLEDRMRDRPRALSGGQAQRVALARALVTDPRLLLLDEPLAALDAHTRLEVRSELRRHLADFAGVTVLVTHDPLDAMVLADRLVVIENGTIVQQGTPAQVARTPRTDYVAQLVGLNLYRGTADGHTVTLTSAVSASTGAGTPGSPDSSTTAQDSGGGVSLDAAETLHGDVFLAFRPASVALFRSRPDGSPRNLWQAVIGGIELHGDQVRIHLDGPIGAAADITPAALAGLGLTEGSTVWAAVKATDTHAYPA
jgi:molybdate transport system ATP-binding protein